jgi:hypothetical protein
VPVGCAVVGAGLAVWLPAMLLCWAAAAVVPESVTARRVRPADADTATTKSNVEATP